MNKVFLFGKICTMYSLENGMIKATLLTTHKWFDKNIRELREESEVHNLVMFKRVADIVRFLKVGDYICIEGCIKTNKEYIREDGVTCINKDIVVTNLEFK